MYYEANGFMPPPVGHDIITLCIYALCKAEKLIKRIIPLTYPPSDLRVTTDDGAPITGVIVIDRGKLVVGLITRGCRGDEEQQPVRSMGRPPIDIYRDDSTRLRGWADNDDEDEPWGR